jgi:hypothetical protein
MVHLAHLGNHKRMQEVAMMTFIGFSENFQILRLAFLQNNMEWLCSIVKVCS